ncbi:hypothetical protein RHMOL_Rhmol02G0254700 [Rhododendron molle]|uniref:Uncharacterized protein n=1 Tax=Rhododendron molle TaxID=49168 RepID=A0ACC0PWH1_RHOML|nr:hypothetical protein RHMOL_Rhmol02G0254700 [Rhododendron molle]
MSLSLNHRHPPPQISLSISHYLSPSLIVHLSSMAAIFNRSVRVLLSLRLEWPYVTPVQQDDGPNLAVPIAYKDEFSETMDYYRAVSSETMAAGVLVIASRGLSLFFLWHDLYASHATLGRMIVVLEKIRGVHVNTRIVE